MASWREITPFRGRPGSLPHILVLALLSSLYGIGDLGAVPSFSKKYGTSCVTCHVAYPRLNAMGRAFLYRGYQFPAGRQADIDKSKDEQVKLGAEAYKRIFPDAVWPNTLPTFSAFSVLVESEVAYLSGGDPALTFDDLPAKADLFAGGNFQDDISFFMELEVDDGGARLDAAHIGFDDVIDDHRLDLRIGNIYPMIFPFSHARRLTAPYWLATRSLGDNAWNLDRTQRGLEARGLFAGGRAIYSAGLVEGRMNVVNGEKDFYLHAGYKIGGLPLDGIPEDGPEGKGAPWADNSLRFDAYLYKGTARLAERWDDSFLQAGVGLDAYCGRLNVLSALVVQEDDRPAIGGDSDGSGLHILVEGTYVLFPWLLPNLRYERFRERIGQRTEPDQRFVPALVVLIRANVKASVFAEIRDRGGGYDGEKVTFGLFYGI